MPSVCVMLPCEQAPCQLPDQIIIMPVPSVMLYRYKKFTCGGADDLPWHNLWLAKGKMTWDSLETCLTYSYTVWLLSFVFAGGEQCFLGYEWPHSPWRDHSSKSPLSCSMPWLLTWGCQNVPKHWSRKLQDCIRWVQAVSARSSPPHLQVVSFSS